MPTNHTVTVLNRYGNKVTTSVIHVKDLGSGKAECNIETNFHLEESYDFPATYSTGSREAKGVYRISAKTWTPSQNFIYYGIFTRE